MVEAAGNLRDKTAVEVLHESGLRSPYWAFFGGLNISLYVAGILLAGTTGNLHRFLAEPSWVLMNVFGFVNGNAVLLGLR